VAIGFSFDTSSLLERRRDLLPPEVFTTLWTNVEAMIAAGDARGGLHTLSVSKLSTLHLPIPSLETQAGAVAAIHEVRDSRRRLDVAISSSVDRGATRRRALLGAAFSGQLA
jgi:hypothetical protein